MSEIHLEEKRLNRYIAIYLFLFFISIYLLISSGETLFMTDVGIARIEVIRSITERHDISIPAGLGIGMRGVDGREYSLFGIGSVLVALPLYCIGKFLGASPCNVVGLMNQIMASATAIIVFYFCITLGYTKRASLYITFFYGLGTFAFFYAKDQGDHALETFFVLSAVFFMYRYSKANQGTHLFLSACCFGFAFVTRPTSLLILPPLLILLKPVYTTSPGGKNIFKAIIKDGALFALGFLPFLLLSFWYNFSRFGSIFETGYSLMQTRLKIDFFTGTPMTTGLLGFLVSPGKGFFFYSPVAIIFFFTINSFRKKHPLLALSFIWIMISYLIFLSRNIYWHGDWAWGPRYLLVVTPFLIIPIGTLLQSSKWENSSPLRKAVISLFAVSFAIQLAAVSVKVSNYFVYLKMEKDVPFTLLGGKETPIIQEPSPETYFIWGLSPILTQINFVYEIGRGLKEYRYQESDTGKGYKGRVWMNLYDFWWLHRYYRQKSYKGFFSAAGLAIVAVLSVLRLRRFVMRK